MCSGARTFENELRNENFHFNPCSFSFIYQGVTRNFRDKMTKKDQMMGDKMGDHKMMKEDKMGDKKMKEDKMMKSGH